MPIVRPKPRISVGKLGEYLVATAHRRRSIIHDQREPSPFKTARYTVAERAIRDYILHDFDETILERAETRLGLHEPRNKPDEQRVKLCCEALAAVRRIDLSAALHGANARRGEPTPPTLTFGPVTVSVRPEVIIARRDKRRGVRSGAVKLYFSKTHPLDEKSGEYIGAIVHQHGLEFPQNAAPIDYKSIFVVDVLAQKVFGAPRATERRLKDARAACDEIAIGWDSA
jgi:hypothetical protein